MEVVTPLARIDPQRALDILDNMRKSIEAGEIVAFAAVGIAPDDTTYTWQSTERPVTRLRMMGAITSLLHGYMRSCEE